MPEQTTGVNIMKNDKFDGSNTNTYSRYEQENYVGFKLFVVGLVTSVVGLVVFFVNYL
jgi:hypothetical protein